MRHAAVPAPRARHRHDLQLPRPARQPGPAGRPGDRLRRPADGAGDGRACSPARGVDAWVFRGDDGLDELTTTTTSPVWVVHDGEVTDRDRRPGRARHRAGAPPRTCAAATPRTTPTSYAGCSAASRARCATPCCSTPAPRWPSTTPPGGAGRRRRWRPASPGPREAVDSGARAGDARPLGRRDLRLRASSLTGSRDRR